MKKILIPILILLLCTTVIYSQTSGEEKIQGMKQNISKDLEKDKEEKNSSQKDEESENSDNNTGSIGWEITKAIFRLLFEVMSHVRYSDYPYSVSGDHHYADFAGFEDDEDEAAFHRLVNFNVDMQTAYLQDGVFSINNRFFFNLSALHFHFNQQSIWAGSQYFNSLSLNLGLNISINNFSLSAFVGGYELNWPLFHQWFTSVGFSSMLFLPSNFWLDYYVHFATEDPVQIQMHSFSLNYSLRRFSLGAGYVYYDYHGTVFHGPMLRFSFWL